MTTIGSAINTLNITNEQRIKKIKDLKNKRAQTSAASGKMNLIGEEIKNVAITSAVTPVANYYINSKKNIEKALKRDYKNEAVSPEYAKSAKEKGITGLATMVSVVA